MKESDKKNQYLTPVENVENEASQNSQIHLNEDEIKNTLDTRLMEKPTNDLFSGESSSSLNAEAHEKPLLLPDEAAYFLDMESLPETSESTCRQPQWSSDDESDQQDEPRKSRKCKKSCSLKLEEKEQSPEPEPIIATTKPKLVAELEAAAATANIEVDEEIERLATPDAASGHDQLSVLQTEPVRKACVSESGMVESEAMTEEMMYELAEREPLNDAPVQTCGSVDADPPDDLAIVGGMERPNQQEICLLYDRDGLELEMDSSECEGLFGKGGNSGRFKEESFLDDGSLKERLREVYTDVVPFDERASSDDMMDASNEDGFFLETGPDFGDASHSENSVDDCHTVVPISAPPQPDTTGLNLATGGCDPFITMAEPFGPPQVAQMSNTTEPTPHPPVLVKTRPAPIAQDISNRFVSDNPPFIVPPLPMPAVAVCPAPMAEEPLNDFDIPQPNIPIPPPLRAVTCSKIDSKPFPMAAKSCSEFASIIQKRAEEVNKNYELLNEGDIAKSGPITDPEELARDTELILKEVRKVLDVISELVTEAQKRREETIHLSSKLRNKFLFIRNIYFSFPKQPIKQREALRIKIADMLGQDELFLQTTRATIEFAYNNGYDDCGQLVSTYTRSIVNPLTILYNFTDAADEFTACVCRTPGLMALLVRIAEEQYEKIIEGTCDKFNRQVVRACVAVTYNCSTRERNRKLLRHVGSVKMLIPYLDCPNEKFQLNALFGLAFLCDEHESEIFQARMNLIEFFLDKMRNAIVDDSRKCSGLSLYEMTRACGRLAINDENKQLLGEAGAIDILVEIASLDDADQEQVDATAALWTLSFEETNKKRIRENAKAMKLLHDLSKNSTNKQVAKSAKGCLWTIGGKQQASVSAATVLDNQIMVSYQWKYQDIILRVRDRLRSMGYKIWIDVEQMGGSTLETMARAVEESKVVLIALSQSYKDGSNTRAEAEYAFTRDKKIIPLRVEANYRPDGWLGIIVGSKLYFDLSSHEVFDQKLIELTRELGICFQGKESSVQATVTPSVETLPPGDVRTNHVTRPVRARFDEDAVKQWLQATQFNSPNLANLTVDHVRCLRNMKSQAPVFHYEYLERLISGRISAEQFDDMTIVSNKLDELG